MVVVVYIIQGTDARCQGAMTTLESLSNIKLNLRPSQWARNGMTFYPLATPDGGDVHLLLGPLRELPCHHPR